MFLQRTHYAAALCLLVFPAFLCAQAPEQKAPEPPKSLADMAREAREKKVASVVRPKIFDNDSLDTLNIQKGPFPEIRLRGPMNDQLIVDSIIAYRSKHSPAELEKAMHEWLDEYQAMYEHALTENRDMDERARDRQYSMYESGQSQPRDMRQAREQQGINARSNMADQDRRNENTRLSSRIQQTVYAVRNGLSRNGIRYEWFQVDCNNGRCGF